jgi:hypothetical protein
MAFPDLDGALTWPVGLQPQALGSQQQICCSQRWRRRSVLGAMLGASGTALVVFAIVSGPTGRAAGAALVTALIFLTIDSVRYVLGQAFERLLDDQPTDGTGDADAER